MRLVSTRSVGEGATLAKAIYNDNGQILLRQGVLLTERVTKRLYELGVSFIYIDDHVTEGIVVDSVLREETKRKAIATIKSEFAKVANDLKAGKTFNGDMVSKGFSTVIDAIVKDIKANPQALSLLTDVLAYDHYIFTHSLNVTVYTIGLASRLGFSDAELRTIGLGAILHDIGKMAIPVEILNKPGRLTEEEFTIIKTHARAGFDLLRTCPNISVVAAHCAYQHHERLDGTGYPRGIREDDIHLYAKMIGITDVFDAVTSNRIYRKPMLPNEALELLYAGVGTQFDCKLVEAFRETVVVYPVGLAVKLSDGRRGIVSKQNKKLSTHPIIRITHDKENELNERYELDLAETINVTIVETTITAEKERSSI